jgi:hypothetical protein
LKTTATIAGLLITLGLIISFGGRDVAATSFTPTGYLVSVSNGATSANANINVTFLVESPSSLAAEHASLIPSAFGVANGTAIPNGAKVGALSLSVNQSQSNGACSNQVSQVYDLYDATTATGTVLANVPAIPSATWPGFLDSNPANGLPDAIDRYPAFLNTLYPGLTPRSRAFGLVLVGPSSTINRAVNVLVFDPGTPVPGLAVSAATGYIVVVVQQDPTATAVPATINEVCASYEYIRQDLGTTLDNPATGGTNEGGVAYRTNPSANGSYSFMEYLRSRRDHDGDGIENQLDSCAFDSTPSWNPRISDPVMDFDGDGIPGQDNPGLTGEQLLAGTGCDPTPLTASSDPDADSFVNRQDNCPLLANASQADPDRDGIGDACDAVDGAADGHLHEVCLTSNITIGAGGAPNPPACPELILDQDNDGFERSVEQHIGTNHQDSCGQNAWPADLYSSGPSTNDVDIQDITSFIAPVRYLNTDVGAHVGDIRWDLVPGSGVFALDINIQDLTQVAITAPPMLGNVRAFNGPACPYAP